jgi:hypothetical protein
MRQLYLSNFIRVFFLILFSVGSKIQAQDLEQIGKTKPVRLSGSFSMQAGPYVYIGKGIPRNEPFWWQLNGSPNLSIYGWQLPFSFNYGSRNRSFVQPFNRFGVSPYYSWLKFHFGYSSIRMNPFVMTGLQFLGAGVEMNPKGFRFAAFYGRFAKPIARDTFSTVTSIPAYRRIGYGVKIGVGSQRSYVDLSLVKVNDDTTSIPKPDLKSNLRPQDNLAIGLGGRLAFGKHVNFQFDIAGSALNRDLSQPLIDTIPELVPLEPLFKLHYGFQFLTAGQASLQYTHKYFGLRVQVRRVDPDYRSLAAFYLQTDMQSVTVEPSFRLMKNKLRLTGSIGRQQDNISKRKAYTAVRTIGSANLSWSPKKEYNLNVSYSNYGMAQQAGLQLIKDTFRIAQNNQSISVGQQYSINNKQRTITLMMNVSYQQLKDLNPYGTYASGNNKVWFANLTANRIRVKDNLSIQGGLNISNNEFATGSYLLLGPLIGVSRPLVKNKIQASGTLSYNLGYQGNKASGSTINFYSSFQYQLSKTHQFSLTLNVLQNSTPFLNTGNFTEIRLLAGYILIFQPKS